MEEKYKKVIEFGLNSIQLKLMVKFGLSASDVKDIMEVYLDDYLAGRW